MRVIWSDPALAELASIREYIATDSPLTAEKFTLNLHKKIDETLRDFPKYGRKIPEMDREDFREIIHGNYRIMYHVEKEVLSILAVRNSRQIFKGKF